MSKQYTELAKQIVDLVGGKENITNVYHCQTRLRFSLVEQAKAKTEEIEALSGVVKVMINAGVYQVVIGTHVADVFEEIEKFVDIKKDASVQEEKQNFINTIISFIAGTFQPIIPALSGAGMVKAVMALLVVFKVIDNTTQTYYMLNVFADGVFYFLPIMIAYCEAKKLKCNEILAAGVAAMMLHPNWVALVGAGEAVHFFNIIPFRLVSYGSSVIPIVLVIFVQAYVEKTIRKITPKSVELVFVPMLTFLVMGTLAFSILGPLGNIVGGYLATFFTFLSINASWAPAVLIGGFLPVMVMFGLHNGVAPLGVMQMAELGYDSIFGPGCVCSNMAQATAGLVVALRTKDGATRQTAASGSITAYMGITEPILYGINLPKRYPLVSAMIGGGLGGLYAGLTHTHRFATGSSGLPAVLLYIGDDTMTYFYNILIALVITIVSTAIITFVLSLKYEKKNGESVSVENANFIAPVEGKVMPISQASDEVFASEALGKGAVIIPSNNVVVAPFNGKIATLFPTKHAVGIVSDSGVECLIHVGIDTVNLQGKYFKTFVNQGDTVKAGQKLLSFDKEAIEKEGYKTETMVVVSNSASYESVQLINEGTVTNKDELIVVA